MRSNLIFGLMWAIFFQIFIFTDDGIRWFHFGYLAVAAMYLGTYLYQRRYGYLTLENGVLKLNDPRRKYINLNEVTHFKYFAGDYILESEQHKVKVNNHLLDEASLELFKLEMMKYGLQPGTSRKIQVESD
ncbi:hypothetical protein LVD13_02355 [Flavobacteriaceae bacterium D16]|nr:hypothetical protein [Flavobacteriaceae bacterium D16]